MKQPGEKGDAEIPWDLVDRCLLPLIFSHAAAVILTTILSTLRIASLSLVSIFIPSLALTLALTLFYHNLKVSCAGKVVVVTGCESRIGFTVAKHLDELGLKVIAGFSRYPELKEKLKEECSGRLEVTDLDVGKDESIKALVEHLHLNVEGGLWGVVNAASWTAFGEAEWVPPSAFRKMVDVNLVGAVALTSALLPFIRKTKGRVVNLASIHGRIASGVRAPLSTVTAGIAAYSHALRLAMARWGVDVVLVEAGTTTSGAWYNQKEMLDEARRLWQHLSADQKADYGEDYFEFQITNLKEYTNQQEELFPLVKSIGDAVTRTFPLARYTPVTKREKLQTFVAEHLPHSVYSILYE